MTDGNVTRMGANVREQPREDWKPFADRLGLAIRESGRPAYAIAEDAGTSSGTVSKLTKALRGPPRGKIMTGLARVLNVRIEWLVNGEEPMRPWEGRAVQRVVETAPADPLEEALAGEWWGDRLPPPRLAAELARDARAERALAGPEGRQGAAYWRAWLREDLQRRMRPDKAIPNRVDDTDDLGDGLAAVPKLPKRKGARK